MGVDTSVMDRRLLYLLMLSAAIETQLAFTEIELFYKFSENVPCIPRMA